MKHTCVICKRQWDCKAETHTRNSLFHKDCFESVQLQKIYPSIAK